MLFQGQTALITGATGDIGYQIAKLLHSQGAELFLTGRNQARLEQLAQEFACKAYYCDLRETKEIYHLLAQLALDDLDILVCNAGMIADNLVIKMSDLQFAEVLQVNLHSNFILNREIAKKMLIKRAGRIINISTIVAKQGNLGQANYAAAKAGLVAMTKSLAQELASKNITVNCVAPGFIETSMTAKLTATQKAKILAKIPAKRMGKAVEIAQAVAFLASENAAYITGQELHVNGGMG